MSYEGARPSRTPHIHSLRCTVLNLDRDAQLHSLELGEEGTS